MAQKIVIFMIVLAVLVTAFGLSTSVDFFQVSRDVFDRLTAVTDPLVDGISYLFVGASFDADDTIEVVRYFFDDGHYCDVARRLRSNVLDSVAFYTLVYSTNENVTRYAGFRLLDTLTFKYSFTNAAGDVIYKVGMFKTTYHWTGSYFDYCLDKQKNPSVEGWTKFNVVPLG